MNLFKFTPSGAATSLDGGAPINGYSKVTWVERYNAPGDFSIEAPMSSGLTNFLPLGTMISHQDTFEVMIVENHEIRENVSEDSQITISGRSFISYLENRIVGMNGARSSTTLAPYTLSSTYLYSQIVTLINDHINNPPANTNDVITNFSANHSLAGGTAASVKTIEHKPLLDAVLELLKTDDYGIRTIRKNPFNVTGGSSTQSNINIYKGANLSSSIMFSWATGDISEAQYLFSQKEDKNSALVVGQYVQVVVDGLFTNYERRTILVDGSDIDGHLGAMPTGQTLTDTVNAMSARGQLAIYNKNKTSLTQIDLSENAKPQFRRDYNIGDLVLVDANFGQMDVRRITEYAEIEDENGKSGHPTLSPSLEGQAGNAP